MEVVGRTRILLPLSRIKVIAQRKSVESQTELKMSNSPLWLPHFLSYIQARDSSNNCSDVSELDYLICLPQSPQLITVPSVKWLIGFSSDWKTKGGPEWTMLGQQRQAPLTQITTAHDFVLPAQEAEERVCELTSSGGNGRHTPHTMHTQHKNTHAFTACHTTPCTHAYKQAQNLDSEKPKFKSYVDLDKQLFL